MIFLYLVMAAYGVSYLTADSVIAEPIRNRLTQWLWKPRTARKMALGYWFENLVSCAYCSAFWISAALVAGVVMFGPLGVGAWWLAAPVWGGTVVLRDLRPDVH